MATVGSGRPEGLPRDEELEEEIQAYLERASHAGGRTGGGKPEEAEEPGAESETQAKEEE